MKNFLLCYYSVLQNLPQSRKERAALLHERAWCLLDYAVQEQCARKLSTLSVCYGEHGKPFFADFPVRFNLSHCTGQNRGLACCALSSSEIGVDCAALRPYDDRLALRICTPDEYARLLHCEDPALQLMTLWTQKESSCKLHGQGLSAGLKIEVPAQDGIWLQTFHPTEDFLITLCGSPPEQPPLLYRV